MARAQPQLHQLHRCVPKKYDVDPSLLKKPPFSWHNTRDPIVGKRRPFVRQMFTLSNEVAI